MIANTFNGDHLFVAVYDIIGTGIRKGDVIFRFKGRVVCTQSGKCYGFIHLRPLWKMYFVNFSSSKLGELKKELDNLKEGCFEDIQATGLGSFPLKLSRINWYYDAISILKKVLGK